MAGRVTNIFSDILRSEEARPTLAVWLLRLAAIALVLIGSSTSVSRPAAASTQQLGEGLAPKHAPIELVGSELNRTAASLSGSEVRFAAAPFYFKGPASERDHAIDCLASAAWYEAGDDLNGERSVMQVVLNRVRHPAFPSTVCGVVFEGSRSTTGCQFTFTCDGSLIRRHPSEWELGRARQLAADALDGQVDASVGQATHYHADYVSPSWSTQMKELATVGLHIFYRWPAQRGYLSARANVGQEMDYRTLASEAVANYVKRNDEPPQTSSGSPDLVAPVSPTPALAGPSVPKLPASLPPPTSTLFLAVDPSAAGGAWALTALGDCVGRRDCQVLAYGSGEAAARNRAVPAESRDRPLFLFVRDGGSGMEISLWDCSRIHRANVSQCLPSDSKALAALMAERSS